jgi:hypothetical protein
LAQFLLSGLAHPAARIGRPTAIGLLQAKPIFSLSAVKLTVCPPNAYLLASTKSNGVVA